MEDLVTEVRGETAVELRLTVLGGTVAATIDGELRSLGGPMQRRLLAALLADAGSMVSIDRLVDSLWPEDAAPVGARRTVMSYVSRLRSVIGADRVVGREPGYVLVLDGVSYDAADFELLLAEARAADGEAAVGAYDRALGLWSGRAFGDDADEWWLRPVAARLEELRLVTLEERAEVQLSLGRHAEAVADLERGVAEQPLRERFVELLMRALYLSGRQAEALRTYRRFHDYLAEETGLAPSDELVELEHRMVIGDASLVPPSTVAVPGYELGEVIGEGAFGSVYRAVQPSIGREVAVKVVRAELADDPRFVQRFEAEAQLVARLEHPHVVPLYDFWRRPGGAFLVFRLLRGGSLADRVAQGPMAAADVARVVGEMASALAAAHSIGIVHRDVKPANVLFDEGGNTYLADFGIAVMADAEADPDLRAAGSAMYASPEQARDGVATEASDQYALAVVAWEALTGRAPFDGTSTVEVLRTKYVTPLPALGGEAPGATALTAVLQRATAPNPQDRYPSMADFTAAVDAAVADADGVRTTGRLGDAVAPPRPATTTMVNLPVVAANPFKGLRAFGEADAVDFFGRAALIDRLVATVEGQPFTAVVGPSGSGKSSLVHAGAVPALRRAGALVASMVPGDDPLVELEAALRRVATVADEGTISARLATPGGLAVVAAELAGPDGRLVLVLDQFEELWTLVGSDAVRDRFVELIANAAVPGGPLRVIATLRADLYDRPLRHPVLGPIVSDSTLAVTPLSSAELAEAIEEPAARIGVRFEPGLAATMVSDVAERPGALPLLQFTLTELYELRTQSTITVEAYQHLGGVSGALASRAEKLYLELDDHRRGDVRTLFTELVMPGDDADDLRRRARLEELAGIDPAVIERYRTNRLLVTDHHPITREPTVEVAHEALLREWPRLATWIDEDRDAIRVRRMIGLAATEWHDADRDESMLYRGPRLSAADDVARRLPLPVPEQEFLAASHELADREQVEREARVLGQARQNRRLRGLLAATAVVLVVALLAGILALQQSRRSDRAADAADRAATEADRVATEATQARIVADAERLAPTDRDLSMLLAVEAARRQADTASAGALAAALLTEPDFVRYEGDTADARGYESPGNQTTAADWPAFSPDSTQVAVPDSDAGEVRISDVRTGAERRVLDYPALDGTNVVRDLIWSPSDTLILVTSEEVVGIDAASGVVRMPATSLPERAAFWALSDSGRRLAVVTSSDGTDGTVTVYAVPSGEVLTRLPAPCCGGTYGIGGQNVPASFPGAVAWRGNDLYVASGTGTIEQWDPDDGRRIRTLGTGYPAAIDIQFVDDGATLVISGVDPATDMATMAYDADTGAARWDAPEGAAGMFAADPRNDAVVVTSPYSGATVMSRIDLATGKFVRTWDSRLGSGCFVRASPDGRVLAGFSCERSALALWSLDGTGAALQHVTDYTRLVTFGGTTADGRYSILVGLEDSLPPDELDIATGEITPIELPPGVTNFSITPTGSYGALAASGKDVVSNSEPVDRPSEVVLDESTALPGTVTGYAGSIDLRAFKYADGSIVVYDGSGEPGVPISYDGPSYGMMISADQERLYVGGFPSVRVYDVRDGSLLDSPFPGLFLSTSTDGKVLASFTGSTVILADGETDEPLGDPIDVAGAANVALSPDGTMLRVIDNTTGQMQLYDVASQARLGPIVDLEWGGPAWYSEIIGARNSFLLQRDGTAMAELTLDPERWREQACIAAGRNLTAEEWATHIGGTPRATCPQYPAPA
jgi:DNA-binding SARP family transcriptional activator/WD40 repeat protein/tRNA A-37 threonylcarbamoyl transferase component Bud32/energy-coupling factor transporter ATP-binding protein EcfA2